MISCRKKQQQKEETSSSFFILCTSVGSCFIFSSHSLVILTLALHPFPAERIAFLCNVVVLLPTSESRGFGPSVLTALQILGPIDAFSKEPFSLFGVPQSRVEEEHWELQSCL